MAGLDPAIQPRLSRVERAFWLPGDELGTEAGQHLRMGPGLRRDSEIGGEAA